MNTAPALALGQGLELRNDAVELLNERIASRLPKNIHQSAVIPERSLLAAGEAVEDSVAFEAIIGEDFAGVGEFVRGGDQVDIGRLVDQPGDVFALAFVPFALLAGNFVRVGTAVDDTRDVPAKFSADFVEAREAALVLDGVMQECGDDFVFAAAMLNDDGGDSEQMADIRLAFALAALVEVQVGGVAQRLDEPVRAIVSLICAALCRAAGEFPDRARSA